MFALHYFFQDFLVTSYNFKNMSDVEYVEK